MNDKSSIVICHVIHSFTHIGGAENGIINIINNFGGYNVKHVVCSLTDIGEIENRITADNVVFCAVEKRAGNDPLLPFKLMKVFQREKVNVVHLRGWATMLEGYIGAKLCRVERIIYSEHGRHFDDILENKVFKYKLKQYLYNKFDSVMTVSSDLKRELSELYKLSRPVDVIHNGVDVGRFFPRSRTGLRARFGWAADEKIIGIVGRLCEGKGLEEYLTAYEDCKLSARLVVVGDGPLRGQIEACIRRGGLERRVTLLGARNDVPELLSCFDVFALPSASEGLSNVLLEAMASGLPVVAFRVGGNGELVDSGLGGYLVENDNWGEFSSKVLCLLSSFDKALRMGLYNREKVIASFCINKMIDSYRQIYGISTDSEIK